MADEGKNNNGKQMSQMILRSSSDNERVEQHPSYDMIDPIYRTAEVSKEEYQKMLEFIKRMNKPAVKTIEVSPSEIYDCVEIHKQRAFDHPLLKDHVPQMNAVLSAMNMPTEVSSSTTPVSEASVIPLPCGGCPPGTVPQRRILLEDLLRAGSVDRFGKKP